MAKLKVLLKNNCHTCARYGEGAVLFPSRILVLPVFPFIHAGCGAIAAAVSM